jgi:hypothetical protein
MIARIWQGITLATKTEETWSIRIIVLSLPIKKRRETWDFSS